MKWVCRAPPRERRVGVTGRARAGPPGRAARLALTSLTLALCLASGQSKASSIGQLDADYDRVAPLDTVHLSVDLDGLGGWEVDADVFAGVYRLWLDPRLVPGHDPGDPLGPGLPQGPDAEAIAASATPIYQMGQLKGYKLGTFCADVVQGVITGPETYDVYLIEEAPVGGVNPLGGMGLEKADDLRKLFGLDILPAPLMFLTAPGMAEAFQACVWEVIYEDRAANGYDLASGNVQVSGVALQTDANQWLADILADIDDDLDMNEDLRALVADGGQDFVLQVPGLGREPLPEPVTMLGVLLGIAAGAGYFRKRVAA